ncbi:hypothetical protein LRE75_36080 [Streptomyces sp. 372A]
MCVGTHETGQGRLGLAELPGDVLLAAVRHPLGESVDQLFLVLEAAAGNETGAAPAGGTARSGESWSDYNQLTSITAGGTTYQAEHAGTTNDERTKFGDTWFHHTQLGLASTDTGFAHPAHC